MHYWKTALFTLLIFALGGLAGSLITAQVIKTRIERVEVTRPLPGMHDEEFVPLMMRVMEKQLQLTAEQTTKARDIMRQAQRDMMRLNGEWRLKAAELEPGSPALLVARNEWRIRSRKAMAASDDAIRGLLTPAQLPSFEEYLHKRRTLMQERPGNAPLRPADRPPLPPRGPRERENTPP